MDGIFSIDIKIFGLLNPNILICLVPEIASEKFTSIEGVVSKLSDRLQQAAFNNSSELKVVIFCEFKNETFDDLNYNLCDGDVVKLDKIINQLYLEGINPIALLRSVGKHFQKILFVNQKIDSGININESLNQLKPPIFFLYINQFKNQVTKWKTVLCYKAIERIMETEELCKLNSKISKVICWRTLRNIASIKYN